MRLRFRDFDHLSKARAAAGAPFFLIFDGEEIMEDDGEDEESFQSRWLREDEMSSLVNVSALSPIEKLSFARAHTQFLSSIFPRNCEEIRPKCDEQQDMGKGYASFQAEPPEMHLWQVSNCTVFQVEPPEMELSQVSDFSIFQVEHLETELSQVSHFSTLRMERPAMELSQVNDISIFQAQPPEMELSQVIFKMMKDTVISTSLYSSPDSVDEDLESTIKCKGSTSIVSNSVPDRISLGRVESSMFLKCVGSPFQFEVYEVGLDNYDLRTVREALLLVDLNDQLKHFDLQISTIYDYPELSCSMHHDLLSFFNREHSLNHISEEHLKLSPTYKRIEYETEISAANPISSAENKITMEGEFSTAAQICIFEVPELFGGRHSQTFEFFKDLMDAIQVTFEESTDSYVKSEISFHDLVVVPELNLTDNTFKSLPTPSFVDDKEVLISLSIIKTMCNQYNPHLASASDCLYLDWHQSKGGTCNNCNCSSIQKKIEDEGNDCLTNYRIPYTTMTTYVFSTIEYFEQSQDNYCPSFATELPECVSLPDSAGVKAAAVTNGEQDISGVNIQSGQQNTFQSNSKDCSLFSSTSVSSDLSFFLNARRGSIRYEDPLAKKIGDNKGSSFLDNCKPRNKSELSNDNVQKNQLQMHHVEMSKCVLEIFDSLQAKFESVLASDHDLRRVVDTFPDMSKLCIINSSQTHLMSSIKNRASKKDSLDFDSVLRGLVTMHVLHKTAFYICFYGIHVAHLYMKKLAQSLSFLEESIQPLYTLIKDAFHKSENGLIEEHPMISSLEQILKSDFRPQCDYKILLVAERKSFLALHQKITALNLKLHEFVWTDKLSNQWSECREKSQLNQAVLDVLAQCDCLIVSHRSINASFPFDLFNSIVEYDDSDLSSQISCIIARIAHKCNIHLIRVQVRGKMISSLFTETLTKLTNLITEEGNQCWLSSLLQDGLNDESTEWQLTDGLTIGKDSMQTSLTTDTKFEGEVPESNVRVNIVGLNADSPMKSSLGELDFVDGKIPQVNEVNHMIVIINIREFDEEMIGFRRSSYQKILAMEKEGLQVIEREYNLPVDLIFGTSVCLVWYTARKLGHYKSSTQDCTISTGIANVADNLLMSLSFSFQDCIMIFEGEDSFLTEVIEASDDLYASSVGMGIRLHCFLSGSSETTDNIVLNCIRMARKSTEVSYPAMMESETLGEFFLTKFPSINPVTAHAVLSCAGSLSEFICQTLEYRLHLMAKFNVLKLSAILFSVQCKYGELGETQSCTTDCSSTLTSPINADRDYARTEINSDNLDTTVKLHSEDILVNDYFDTNTPSFSFGFKQQPSEISQRSHKQISKSCEWVDNRDYHKNNEHITELNWGRTLDDATGYTNSGLVDELNLSPTIEESVSVCKNFRQGAFGRPQYNISSGFSNSNVNTEYPLLASSNIRNTSKPSNFDVFNQLEQFQNNLRQYSSSTQINSQIDPWNNSNKSTLCSFNVGPTREPPQLESNLVHFPSSLEMGGWNDEAGNWKQKSIRDALERSRSAKQDKLVTNSADAFFRKGPDLSYVQQKFRGSQDLLHRVPNEYPSAEGNKMASESLHPSIFDSYRYRSEVESRPSGKRKRKNLLMYFNKSPGKITQRNSLSSSLQSWTPVDKRAKKALTFVRGRNKQSRLVWSNSSN